MKPRFISTELSPLENETQSARTASVGFYRIQIFLAIGLVFKTFFFFFFALVLAFAGWSVNLSALNFCIPSYGAHTVSQKAPDVRFRA